MASASAHVVDMARGQTSTGLEHPKTPPYRLQPARHAKTISTPAALATFLPRNVRLPGFASPPRLLTGGDSNRRGILSPARLAHKRQPSAAAAGDAATIWESQGVWIALYFAFNLGLTLYNKIALNTFPFPWALTAIHSLSALLGSYYCGQAGYFPMGATQLRRQDFITLAGFSALYTINIAVSNVSLSLVSVPLHQVIRSTTPLFTIAISLVILGKRYLRETYLSLVPVILGVILATSGDYSCTALGVALTLLSAFLASVKGIVTNRILVGPLKFHPLELLWRMSPMAFAQCFVMSLLAGEIRQIYDRTLSGQLTRTQWLSILVNGAVAFGLNVVSFTANKKCGALTMDVAANVKQVLTIVLAVMIFSLELNAVNLLGIALTIAGGAYYSYIETRTRAVIKDKPLLPSSSLSSAGEPLLLSVSTSSVGLGLGIGAKERKGGEGQHDFLPSLLNDTASPASSTVNTPGGSANTSVAIIDDGDDTGTGGLHRQGVVGASAMDDGSLLVDQQHHLRRAQSKRSPNSPGYQQHYRTSSDSLPGAHHRLAAL